jgi:hypothetical protein
MSFALIVIGLAAVMTALNNTWKTARDGGRLPYTHTCGDATQER